MPLIYPSSPSVLPAPETVVPTTSADANTIIGGLERMIFSIARKRASRVGLDNACVDEIAQNTRVHLWQHSIPQFNPAKKTKMSTYLFVCIQRKVAEEIRRMCRLRRKNEDVLDLSPIITAPDVSLDRKIEALSDDIQARPEKYLTLPQARAFKAFLDSPGMLMKDLAAKLGYLRASSHSMMMGRIKKQLADISIEDWELSPSTQGGRK
jgi:DNA-directed RNA polymerase specialized sigma24 family protein